MQLSMRSLLTSFQLQNQCPYQYASLNLFPTSSFVANSSLNMHAKAEEETRKQHGVTENSHEQKADNRIQKGHETIEQIVPLHNDGRDAYVEYLQGQQEVHPKEEHLAAAEKDDLQREPSDKKEEDKETKPKRSPALEIPIPKEQIKIHKGFFLSSLLYNFIPQPSCHLLKIST